VDHPLYHYLDGRECNSPHGFANPLSLRYRVYGVEGLQLVRRCIKDHEKEIEIMLKWSVETVWLWVHFGVLILGEGPCLTYTGGVGNTHSTRSMNEKMGGLDGSSGWRAYRQV
jgi:hypothetical protein